MPPRKKHRVLITNPRPVGGQPDVVVKGVVAKGYIIVPIEAGLFEVYIGNKYLGEAENDAQIRKLIERDGAKAPVLIENPSGGYEMYSYTRPKSNPKKRKKGAKKKKSTKRKASKKKAPRKKNAKRKVSKKKATKRKASKKKMSPRKKKRVAKAKKKVKKAKKKVKSAKKGLRKAKSALGKAKRSKNPSKPTTNPRKKKKASKKKASSAPRSKATLGDINAYVKRVTGSKF